MIMVVENPMTMAKFAIMIKNKWLMVLAMSLCAL
jgi:hypothetical protein